MDEDHSEDWPIAGKEFFAHLLAQERTPGLPVVDEREYRLCVEWIVRACSDYGFKPNVAGLATKFFGVFLHYSRSQPKCTACDITFKQLMVKMVGHILDMNKHNESALCEMMCIVSIAIAAKKVEPKSIGPYLGDFDENFTFAELKKAESTLLGFLRWNIAYSTPYEFVQYWMPLMPRGIDRKKCQDLCFEAIGACLPEVTFYDSRPSLFAAASILWALTVMNCDATQWTNEISAQLGCSVMESVWLMQDDICLNASLRKAYPHAAKPHCRSDSPAGVMDMHVIFEKDAGVGLKRPVPERPSDGKIGNHKVARVEK
jgi:hypothetical protein